MVQTLIKHEPDYCELLGVWLYGNVGLLRAELAYVAAACGQFQKAPRDLVSIEREAEEIVLGSKVLVCGIHNLAHRRAAVVPLQWGSPRIVVLSGGFRFHLGKHLDMEPFAVARLWRHRWDPLTDLAISRRAPGKLPTFANYNPTVDRLIESIAKRQRRVALLLGDADLGD